jgi:hypothetical protein
MARHNTRFDVGIVADDRPFLMAVEPSFAALDLIAAVRRHV